MVKLPERWDAYSPIGSLIPSTRIITFKVPLKEHMVASLPPHERLTIPKLLEKIPELGLIIDLTMTAKYYNKHEILDRGVCYAKIATPGQQIPNDRLVSRFFSVIDTYLRDHANDTSLIGVHCTHGVNRTGYLIARYLIERLGLHSNEAVELVGRARGHPIERSPYIRSLQHCKPMSVHGSGQSRDIELPKKFGEKKVGKVVGTQSKELGWRSKRGGSESGKESPKFLRDKGAVRSGIGGVKEKERGRPSTSHKEEWIDSPEAFHQGPEKKKFKKADPDERFYEKQFKKHNQDFIPDMDRFKVHENNSFPMPIPHEPHMAVNYESRFSEHIEPPNRFPHREEFPEHQQQPVYGRPPGGGYSGPGFEKQQLYVPREERPSFREPNRRYQEPIVPQRRKEEERGFRDNPSFDLRPKFEGHEVQNSHPGWGANEHHSSRPINDHRDFNLKDPHIQPRPERPFIPAEKTERDRNWAPERKYERDWHRKTPSPERFRRPHDEHRLWPKEDKIPPREDFRQKEGRFFHQEEPREYEPKPKFGHGFKDPERPFIPKGGDRRDPNHRRPSFEGHDPVPYSTFEPARHHRNDVDHRHDSLGRKEEKLFDQRRGKYDDFWQHDPNHKEQKMEDPGRSRYDHHSRGRKEERNVGHVRERAFPPEGNFNEHVPHLDRRDEDFSFPPSERFQHREEFNPRVVNVPESSSFRRSPYHQREYISPNRRREPYQDRKEFYNSNSFDRELNVNHRHDVNEGFPRSAEIRHHPISSDVRRSSPIKERMMGNSGRMMGREVPSQLEVDLREEISMRRSTSAGRRQLSRTPPRREIRMLSPEDRDCRELINQKRVISYDERVEPPLESGWAPQAAWERKKKYDKGGDFPDKSRSDGRYSNKKMRPQGGKKVFERLERSHYRR